MRKDNINVEEFTKKLLPITELRRNAGAILSELVETGSFILTKNGNPIAELIPLKKEGGKRFSASKGAWVGTKLEKIDFYKSILKWRKKGSRRLPFEL